MKTLIIEDEKAAVRNLRALLADVAPDMDILAITDSITETVEWLQLHPMPELIFMDIHLADGSAFEIFDEIEISCPIIFTTAYDEYALKAFRVNSIDYLLKPINRNDIQRSLNKLIRLHASEKSSRAENHPFTGEAPWGETNDPEINNRGISRFAPGEEHLPDYRAFVRAWKQEEHTRTHFLIPVKGDKLLPLSVDMILYFYIADGNVKVVVKGGKEYLFNQTLDELGDCLDPGKFFRVNRQYLISRTAVKDIDMWFNGRLSVNLIVPAPERILVSKARATDFKVWFTS